MESSPRSVAFKARLLFPVSSPPLTDGVITIEGDRITAVGENTSGRPPRDLGNVAILPGLVNAHTHLEFSLLRNPVSAPGTPFCDWIREVVAYRRNRESQTPATSSGEDELSKAVQQGLRESAVCGVTTLGEIATTAWPADRFPSTAIRCAVFWEQIGLPRDRVSPLVEQSRQWLQRLTETTTAWLPGLSPHAPFSAHADLVMELAKLSTQTRSPLAMHLAESQEEVELLQSGGGEFVPLLEQLGAWDPQALSPGLRALDYLRILDKAHRALIIHGNYLSPDEMAYLADRRNHMSVVYCPRTHAYFGHRPYPLLELLRSGVRVAIGTDSRASNPDLGVLDEMRLVAKRYPELPGKSVLRLGTRSGAEALGWDRETGDLSRGKTADLAIVRLPDGSSDDPHRLLLDSSEPVIMTFSRGQIIYEQEA